MSCIHDSWDGCLGMMPVVIVISGWNRFVCGKKKEERGMMDGG